MESENKTILIRITQKKPFLLSLKSKQYQRKHSTQSFENVTNILELATTVFAKNVGIISRKKIKKQRQEEKIVKLMKTRFCTPKNRTNSPFSSVCVIRDIDFAIKHFDVKRTSLTLNNINMFFQLFLRNTVERATSAQELKLFHFRIVLHLIQINF